MRFVKKWLFFFGLCLLLTLFVVFWHLPLNVLEIYIDKGLSREQVESLIAPHVSRFWLRMSSGALRRALMKTSMVSGVDIYRIWPDRWQIWIHTHQPWLLWNNHEAISVNGVWFSPLEPLVGLPHLFGEDTPQAREALLAGYRDLSQRLALYHRHVQTLRQTPGWGWILVTDRGEEVRLWEKQGQKLAHWLKKYSILHKERPNEDVVYVDLRYPRGVAIRWKPSEKKSET